MKASTGGAEGKTPVATAFVQKIAEGRTSHELSWRVEVMIQSELKKRAPILLDVLFRLPFGSFCVNVFSSIFVLCFRS